MPVFTIEDAVGELNEFKTESTRPDIHKAMDEFFLSNLPENIFEIYAPGSGIPETNLKNQNFDKKQANIKSIAVVPSHNEKSNLVTDKIKTSKGILNKD